MGDPVVYRSNDPEVLAAWAAAETAEDEHHRRLNAWLDTLTPPGEERRVAVVTRSAWDGGQTRLIGLQPYLRERPEDYPAGWRKRANDSYLTPYGAKTRNIPADAREAAERARAALAAHDFPPDLRRALRDLGMPDRAMEGNRIATYGAALMDGYVYANWTLSARVLEEGRSSRGDLVTRAHCDLIDLTRWHRVPLSEWYALREARGEAA